VLSFKKGKAAAMDEDEVKHQILQAANNIKTDCASFLVISPSVPTTWGGYESWSLEIYSVLDD
jgi:hypothetical protein